MTPVKNRDIITKDVAGLISEIDGEVKQQSKTALLKDTVSYKKALTPPRANCTHTKNFGECAFFFMWDCFGMVIPLMLDNDKKNEKNIRHIIMFLLFKWHK